MRHIVLAIVGTAVLAGVASGATKGSSSLATPPAVCASGTCSNGKGGQCAANADCRAGGLASASKWSLDGNLVLKASFKGVTLPDGVTPVTTDQVLGSADDYVFALCLRAFLPGPLDACVYTHAEVKNGSGRIAFDAGSLGGFFPTGTVVALGRVALFAPPSDPSTCRGNNDTRDPQTYFANQVGLPTRPGCEDGGALAVGGIVNAVVP